MFTLLLLSIVTCVSLLLLQGKYGRSHIARGALVPSSGMISVYANSALTVEALLCAEGDRVATGTPLIRLVRPEADADGNDINGLQLDLLDRRRVLRRRQLEAAEASFFARDSQLKKQIEGIKRQSAQLLIQSEREAQVVASLEKQLGNLRSLRDQKLLSAVAYEERLRAKLVSEAAAQDAVRETTAFAAQVQMLEAEREALLAQRESDLLIGESEILALEAQHLAVSRRQELSIVAPRDAVVHAIHIEAGQVSSAELPLVSLFPADAVLEAEIYVPGSAIAALKITQRLQLKYDAFPFAKFGGFTARVSRISYAAEQTRHMGAPSSLREPMYRVRAVLEQLTVENDSLSFRLQPGMTFTTSVVAERRALHEWLILPLRRVAEVYWAALFPLDRGAQ